MSMSFVPGDCVQLKSGGQIMVVEAVNGDKIVCRWSKGKKQCGDSFSSATLQKYKPTKPMGVIF